MAWHEATLSSGNIAKMLGLFHVCSTLWANKQPLLLTTFLAFCTLEEHSLTFQDIKCLLQASNFSLDL